MLKRRRNESKSSKSHRPGARARRIARQVGAMVASRGFRMRDGAMQGGTERKFFDNSIAASTLMPAATATWAFSLLNGIAQGTDANQRVGRTVEWASLFMRISVSVTATTAGLPDKYRVVLVYDKQNNASAALPAPTDVFTDNAIQGLQNLDNRSRFIILLDKYFYLGPATTANGGVPTVQDKVYFLRKNIKQLRSVYNGAGATIGTINTGSIFVGVCGHGGLITTPPSGVFKVRLRYTDI